MHGLYSQDAMRMFLITRKEFKYKIYLPVKEHKMTFGGLSDNF